MRTRAEARSVSGGSHGEAQGRKRLRGKEEGGGEREVARVPGPTACPRGPEPSSWLNDGAGQDLETGIPLLLFQNCQPS